MVLCWYWASLSYAQPSNQTPVWYFLCERYAYSGTLEVQLSKTPKGGILKLAIESASTNSVQLAGTTYLFLKNNNSITCTDKNKRSIEGSKIVSYFELNAAEMKQLQQSSIDYIHFNLKGKSSSFSSQLGNFTAVNKHGYFSKDTAKNPNYIDTALAVKMLY